MIGFRNWWNAAQTDLHLKSTTSGRTNNNLTRGECIALTELKRKTDITVHQADKGGNIIILDTALYGQLNEVMLSDTPTYRVLDSDPTSMFSVKLENVVKRGLQLGILDTKQSEYICISHSVMAIFHSFPKVNKGGCPPTSPIVAGIGSLNKWLCAWLDSYLQPLIPALPGYLRDTKQVLISLEGRTWQEL